MRILVIDDNAINQMAAEAQFEGQDLTVVSTYDEGRKAIERGIGYDAVLVDLLMPASGHMQGSDGRKFVGQEMPVGIFLATLAAVKGAKYVGLFTDSNHHNHPASACIDPFNEDEDHPTPFAIQNTKVVFTNNREWLHLRADNFTGWETWSEYYKDRDNGVATIDGKNWAAMLNYVVKS